MRNVCPEARFKLEKTLLSRWGKKHADEALRALARWDGWRWPTERQILDAIPYMAKNARARRFREAKAELAVMRTVPPLTPSEELPLDRRLSPWHALAIVQRGLPMTQVISRIIGGCVLVSVADLQAELDRRTETQADRLAQLQAARRSRERSDDGYRGGMAVVGFTF